jgi:hypothetical protein
MTDMPSENGSVYYHGSSSASLIGVFDKNSPGLKSTGYLVKEGKAPFCGELSSGIGQNGVNTEYVSAAAKAYVENALEYLECEPWTPEIGKERIMRYETNKENYRTEFGAGSEELTILDARSEIENLRIKQWNNLADYEKEAVMKPFPVLYEIKNAKSAVHVTSRFTCDSVYEISHPKFGAEVGIPGPVMPADLVIYVPTENMGSVKNLAKGLQHEPEIRSLDEFKNNLSLSAQKVLVAA